MINTIEGSPNKIALIPKPKSVQIEAGTLNLKHVFRVSDNSGPDIIFAQFINKACLHGIDYRCINSSDPLSEIVIKKSPAMEAKRKLFACNPP